jgi:hypothetical protein
MTSQPPEIATGSLRSVARARVMTGYQYLVERHLGQDVCTWVAERRQAGMSWNQIAKEMTAALGYPEGITMSRTLLQKWCPEEKS